MNNDLSSHHHIGLTWAVAFKYQEYFWENYKTKHTDLRWLDLTAEDRFNTECYTGTDYLLYSVYFYLHLTVHYPVHWSPLGLSVAEVVGVKQRGARSIRDVRGRNRKVTHTHCIALLYFKLTQTEVRMQINIFLDIKKIYGKCRFVSFDKRTDCPA